MFLAVPTTSSPFFFFRRLFCLLAGLCLAFVANVAVTNSAGLQAEVGLRLELPANGNLRVENLRGGVIAELWSENYVSVSAITDSGQESRSPAIVQRTDSLLSMRVPRGAAGAARINLILKIPARAHVAILTSESSVEVRESLEPVEIARPTQRPELIGPEKNSPAAGTPASTSSGPEEISEGDIIRVDTQLVSVNVSVVDRSTNRGVNDLTKENFRLSEDNVAQQIAHFDSASAPFNLVLLVDLSGSTTKVVELIKAAALHFVE